MGQTLTLRRQEANLLIAFTASIIAFVAARTWRIFCFFTHRYYSTSDPQSIVYHQRQAILRNSASPEDSVRLLLGLLWTWRRSRQRYYPLPVLIVSIICISGFTVAGGFSSQVSTAAGDEVLINSDICGYLPLSSMRDAVEAYKAANIHSASNYAQQCYSEDGAAGILDCGKFVTRRLQADTADQHATCPFSDHMCRSTSDNLRLDTGYIDSHYDLGLNAPPNERILWRNILHCAPLVTEGFTSQITDDASSQNITLYHYGHRFDKGEDIDYLYAAPDVASQYNSTVTQLKNSNFNIE